MAIIIAMQPHSFDLFSGVGALAVACGHIFTPALFCEIDEYCIKVLMTRMQFKQLPNKVPIVPGIRHLIRLAQKYCQVRELCDVLCGGFPCQDLSSLNASRKGLSGERSGLIKQVRELAELCLPGYILLENVGALISENNGANGKRVIVMFDEIGYDIRWMCTRSSDFGGAHCRRRVFLLLRLRDDVRNFKWIGATKCRHKRVLTMDKMWQKGSTGMLQKNKPIPIADWTCPSFKLEESGAICSQILLKYKATLKSTNALVPRRRKFDVSRISQFAKNNYLKDTKEGRRHRAPVMTKNRINSIAMWPTPRTASHRVNPMLTNRTCNDLGTSVAYTCSTELGICKEIKAVHSAIKLGKKGLHYANGCAAQSWRLEPWFSECLMHMPVGWTDHKCAYPESSLETTVCKIVCSQNRIFIDTKHRIRKKYTEEERQHIDNQTKSIGNAVDVLQAHCSVNGLFTGTGAVAQLPSVNKQ